VTLSPPAPVVRLLARGYALLFRTLRLEALVEDLPVKHPRDYAFSPELFAFSERDVFGLGGILGRARFTILVARGRDGDWATAAVEELGGAVVRGAFRRGGAAAYVALRRALEAGEGPVGLVVDGPVGPEGEAREGAVACAAATGRPLRPVAAAARRAIVLRGSWSRLWIPLPFTRVVVACGSPMPVPVGAGREARRLLTAELTARIARARAQAVDRARSRPGEGEGRSEDQSA
jgi:lysophospholipid acyltransferase (LPLAT)-like uncharacterized protein